MRSGVKPSTGSPWQLPAALYADRVATTNIYETDRLLAEYLLFHYGGAADTFTDGWQLLDEAVLHFPARCISQMVEIDALPAAARALDVGCAVGRASFELARYCGSVVGIDFSKNFIEAAKALQAHGSLAYERVEEGRRTTSRVAKVAPEIERGRVAFETGDALNLREDLGAFEVVLAANLLCRLREPALFLKRLAELVKPGGQLIITTPGTWMEEFTPRENWLSDETHTTLEGLQQRLAADFELVSARDLPFLIREHARKFQLTVAQASLWRRRSV
jgi:putative 4-mercaptohistidine N1-methyltranferase